MGEDMRLESQDYKAGYKDGCAETKRELQSRLQEAERRAEDALKCLRDHHQWHLDAGAIGLPDGEGGWVEIDDAAEYSDSLLYERTQKALQGFPADDAGPMPRGGISAWWWAQGVLERRKRRSAEHQLAEVRVKQLEILLGSVAPVAELTGAKPLVLYFENDADREEFVALVREAKPDMVSVSL